MGWQVFRTSPALVEVQARGFLIYCLVFFTCSLIEELCHRKGEGSWTGATGRSGVFRRHEMPPKNAGVDTGTYNCRRVCDALDVSYETVVTYGAVGRFPIFGLSSCWGGRNDWCFY